MINECVTKEKFKEIKNGYMYGCITKIWELDHELNTFMTFKSLQSQVDHDLKPVVDRHGETIIDFLENARSQSFYYTYQQTPSVFINGELVRGVVDPDLAAGAICDSMMEPIPDCKSLHTEQLQILDKLYKEREMETRENIIFIRCVVGGLLFLIFIGGYVFFKKMLMSQINKDMENYAQLGVSEYHRVRQDGNTTTESSRMSKRNNGVASELEVENKLENLEQASIEVN